MNAATMTAEFSRRLWVIRRWVRERAAAANVPPYRICPDRRAAVLATLPLPAAAWCLVAPCR